MEKVCPKCKENKDFSCFHKHKGKPFGLAIWCKECAKANAVLHYKNRPREERLGVKRLWQDRNREHVNQYNNEWRKRNPHKHAAKQAKRRALKIKATPVWLSDCDKAHILRFYKLATLMGEITGQKYHVDHIVPLKGKNFCGLHVPNNLRVIPAKDNLKKSNTFDGELL